jgi:histidinol-phosphatase (PHP family)
VLDYHVHTKLCRHAHGEIQQYLEQAIQSGLTEICFTDHIPLPADFDQAHRMTLQQMDQYIAAIERARTAFPELTILTGIEADYYRGFEKYLDKFLSNYEFDLVIMSVHFVKHWADGNWVFDYHFPEKTIAEIYSEYLAELSKGIKTGLFDIIGHIDIIKKKGHSLLQHVPEQVAETFQLLKKYNMTVEINTSGLSKDAQECYPGYDWLPELKRLDLPVSVGSDAHAPEQVGRGFREIYAQIKKHELNRIAVYRQRKIVSYYSPH